MKVAPLHRAFQKYNDSIEHLIVHTGQHYDFSMSDAFFKDLEMPQPSYFLGVGSGTHAEQTAKIMVEFEKVCKELKPDLVIVVGDVNSTIACSITAVKIGIKVAHIEAGLRSFDRTMPEEINRIVTDSICNYCFVTEQSGVDNLIKEGFNKNRIFFVGNTMIDSLIYDLDKAVNSDIRNKLDLIPKEYVLVTLHRPTNVDEPERLDEFLRIFKHLSQFRKIIFPVHPRTRKNLKYFSLEKKVEEISELVLLEPLGYIDFLSLMLDADFILTDSGGIQEESTYLKIPCLTLRTTTERPVTIELGTNILVQPDENIILNAINYIIDKPRKVGTVPELWDGKAAGRIAEIIADILS
ncbi:MAG: UDP-N-acetylglucosamine 2-epimerase [Ignavibacteria bacterium GWB2_35_12]|nr:MAG: UDP-N-acetylglucosamine 2-epimerase [Ignavibacteria bacterium GWA2_35_8]OGU41642.1 MAG: UDP-N-acetylglucosamine 2-epimerase [Ignavibacteria bacterium GWB2_35_12]OGU86987.1 MAG: UDP-N-acetylglucosamine 2-epimerase [Ignavibacteria bacterium RIFOXYA2_FULL_35_10]OGV24977.1 MAG: UDP-N-acetylglucosamine 2-epimerase [Ignavibacteria bacterium RIFOXYC2_FULL_35_21]